jgi:hypothetical protein
MQGTDGRAQVCEGCRRAARVCMLRAPFLAAGAVAQQVFGGLDLRMQLRVPGVAAPAPAHRAAGLLQVLAVPERAPAGRCGVSAPQQRRACRATG